MRWVRVSGAHDVMSVERGASGNGGCVRVRLPLREQWAGGRVVGGRGGCALRGGTKTTRMDLFGHYRRLSEWVEK